MDLIADRGRRVTVEELNTSRLLAHARKQAHQRNLDDILAVTRIPECSLASHLQFATFTFRDIVSKRLGSHYRSGRVDHWLKIKNPAAPAAKREAEEDWGNRRGTRGGSRHRRHPLRYDLTEAGE